MSNNDNMVTIQSQDGVSYDIEVNVAKMSGTLKDLIDDAGTDNAVPLPNVTSKILSKVVDYCKYYNKHPQTEEISPWDLEFCTVDQPTLFELILAANYLDIKTLLDLTCKTVANMIKGKTPDEIRKTFNIKENFTPEEEEQVRKENGWCEER